MFCLSFLPSPLSLLQDKEEQEGGGRGKTIQEETNDEEESHLNSSFVCV